MNAKILKGKSAGGLIEYLNDMKAKDAKILFADGVNTSSNQSVVTSFNLQWANGSSKIKEKMGHLIISFSPKDKERMTDEFVTKLCMEYMKRMNFPPTIYIGYRHLDHEHDHVHIAYSRVDNKGKAITCDTNYARSVKVCKAIREKYGLSVPSWRKKDVNRERLIAKDKVRFNILDIAFPILDKSSSWKEYIAELSRQGVQVTMVKGKDGKTRGIVYTKDYLSFAGSKIDSELSYKNLQVVLGKYEQGNQDFTKGMDFHDYGRASFSDNVAADDSILRTSDTESQSEEHNDIEVGNNTSSQSNGLVDAAIELILQPHQAPVSGGGGGGNSDHDKKKKRDIDNYGPYKRRRR